MPNDKLSSDAIARHAEVLGEPPRLLPLDREAVASSVRATTDRLRAGVSGAGIELAPIPLDAIPEIMFTLCRYPELWQSVMDVTFHIQGAGAKLPIRDRKLAILRTGWLCQAPYEFGEHVNQAKTVGFTSEEIERVVVGSDAPGWSDHDRAVLRAAEELHAGAMVSNVTWAQLSHRLDDEQLFELLILIGQFTATAYFQNSLRLRLEAGNNGLHSR